MDSKLFYYFLDLCMQELLLFILFYFIFLFGLLAEIRMQATCVFFV